MARTTTTPERPRVPAHVQLLLEFTNSVDNEEQTDDLTTPAELTAWLHERDLAPDRPRATTADLGFARELRDAMRDALRAHHEGGEDAAALDELAARLPLRLDHTAGHPDLRPAGTGVRGGLAWLAVAVARAGADDTWRRIKICALDECQWAFFDASKNRSRTWCEWGCGNKVKTRNYRARRGGPVPIEP